MFLGIRRLQKSLGKKGEEPVEGAVEPGKIDLDDTETEEALVSQITGLEELVNKRTVELEEAKAQLQHLATTADSPEQAEEQLSQLTTAAGGSDEAPVEELFTKPNQVGGKSAVAPAGGATEENTSDAAVAEAGGEGKGGEPVVAEAAGSLSDIFTAEEEEENPLAGLINSLPDVSTAELLREAREIEKLIHEWHVE